jgi:hypothetical protein
MHLGSVQAETCGGLAGLRVAVVRLVNEAPRHAWQAKHALMLFLLVLNRNEREQMAAIEIEWVTKVITPLGFPAAIQMKGSCSIQRDKYSLELSAGNANGTDK